MCASRTRGVLTALSLAFVLALVLPAWFGDGPARAADRQDTVRSVRPGWRAIPGIQEALDLAGSERCLVCHGDIESATVNMDFEIGCTFCHGGDPESTVKEIAHVQPTLPVIADQTTAPLDYDLPYQQFVNPSNLRVFGNTCAQCHDHPRVIHKSMMVTAAGHYAGGLYLSGVVETKTPVYGTFAVEDNDGNVPTEDGAVAELLDLVTFDPADDPSLYASHFKAVPGQACARCHLWSRGKGYRGAVGARTECIAPTVARPVTCPTPMTGCRKAPTHPSITSSRVIRRTTRSPGPIPTEQCLHCHHRGARIGLSYTGRAQMPPRLPSGPGVTGTTDVRFNGNYHYTDAESNPPDVHMEHRPALHRLPRSARHDGRRQHLRAHGPGDQDRVPPVPRDTRCARFADRQRRRAAEQRVGGLPRSSS